MGIIFLTYRSMNNYFADYFTIMLYPREKELLVIGSCLHGIKKSIWQV